MKNISNIFERIEWISSEYGYKSINDFAVNGLGYSASEKINRLKDGNKKPSIDIILDISNRFEDINTDWLIFGIEPKRKVKDMLPNETVTKTVTNLSKTKNEENVTELSIMPKVVTIDKLGNDNVVLVPAKAAAGYLLGSGDPEYIQRLPTFNLPNIKHGTFRMFQISGHSMYPTIPDGSYVVGEWCENWNSGIKDNLVYIIVSDEGILIKRVLNRLKKYGSLYLKSDNRKEYPNITLEIDQIKEVWTAKMHLNFDLPDPAILYDRVNDLEAEMEHLKAILKGKN